MKMVCKTMRMKEMAEYLGIPHSENYDLEKDIFDEYEKLDLSELFLKHKRGLALFEEFISKYDNSYGIDDNSYGIDDNSYWKEKIEEQLREDDEIWSSEELYILYKKLEKWIFNAGFSLYRLNQKFNSVSHMMKITGKRGNM